MNRTTQYCLMFCCALGLSLSRPAEGGYLNVHAEAGTWTFADGYVLNTDDDAGVGASAAVQFDSAGGLPYVVQSIASVSSGTDSLGRSIFRMRSVSDYSSTENHLISSIAQAEFHLFDTLTVLMADVGPTIQATIPILVEGILSQSTNDGFGEFSFISNQGASDDDLFGFETPGNLGPYSEVFNVVVTFNRQDDAYVADFYLDVTGRTATNVVDRVELDFGNTLTILGVNYTDSNGNPLSGTTQSGLGLNFNGPQVAEVPAPGALALIATALPGSIVLSRRRRAARSEATSA